MTITAVADTPQDAFTAEDREAALDASRALSRLTGRGSIHVEAAAGQVDHQSFVLPAVAVRLLTDMLVEMAAGRSVKVMPSGTALTTQQAADALNVSRPYLIRLLEDGKLPHYKAGTHRRVRLDDLLAYRHLRDLHADAAMDDLAREAQELALGY